MGKKLTMQERVKLVFVFGSDGATYSSVAEEFNRTYPERETPLNHTTKDAIITECLKITFETLVRVKESFMKKIDACINAEGEQFEHLLCF